MRQPWDLAGFVFATMIIARLESLGISFAEAVERADEWWRPAWRWISTRRAWIWLAIAAAVRMRC